jgi:hypothetical protein
LHVVDRIQLLFAQASSIDIQLGRLTPTPEFPRGGSLRSKFHRLCAFAPLRAMGFLIQATVLAKAQRRKGETLVWDHLS